MKVQRKFGIAAGIAVVSLAILGAPASAASPAYSPALQGNYQAYSLSGAVITTWGATTTKMSAAETGGDTSGSLGLNVCAPVCSGYQWHASGIYNKGGTDSIIGYYLGHY